jgi:hypothetical protein
MKSGLINIPLTMPYKTIINQYQLRLSPDKEGRDLFISVPRLSRRIGGGQGDL